MSGPASSDSHQPDVATARATAEQAARWAKEDSFRMRYGAAALLTGWFITFFVFCLGLTVVTVLIWRDDSVGWNFLPIFLIYGFPVAAIVGLPLAVLVAWPLRRLPDQRIHVLIFGLVLGLVTAILFVLLNQGQVELGSGAVAVWVAVCGALGRASVIKMVTRRNRMAGQ